eukprot:SAG11_NODE_619_length_8173_cov_4.837255_7_plen_155_part_00
MILCATRVQTLGAHWALILTIYARGVTVLFLARMKLPFVSLQHRLRLMSAYSQVNGFEPEITNSLGGERQFEGCLDYIWLSESLRATNVLPVPSVVEARAEGGAPRRIFLPSFCAAQRCAAKSCGVPRQRTDEQETNWLFISSDARLLPGLVST